MNQIDQSSQQNQLNNCNPVDHESFSLPNQSEKSGDKKILVIAGVVLVVALFFAGGIYLRSYFLTKQQQAPIQQIPPGFTFPTSTPPADEEIMQATNTAQTTDSIELIERDLNAIDLKTFEADINKDLENINNSL